MPTPITRSLITSVKSNILYPENVQGNVLSLRANKANKGNIPDSSTKVWSDSKKTKVIGNYINGCIQSSSNFTSTTGFTNDGSTLTTSNGSLIATGTGTKTTIGIDCLPSNSNIYCTVGKILYIRCTLKVPVTATGVLLGSYNSSSIKQSSSIPISGGVEKVYSAILPAQTDVGSGNVRPIIRVSFASTPISNGAVYEVKDLMCIDISSLSMETLNLAQCDEMFAFTGLGSNANLIRYSPLDYKQWSTANTVILNSTGVELTTDGVLYQQAYIPFTWKTTTKYAILYDVVSTTLTSPMVMSGGAGEVLSINTSIPNVVGSNKYVFTSQGTISIFNIKFMTQPTNANGLKIKFKNMRLFELTSNPTMDADFTNLTATELNSLYPMGYNEATMNITNDCTLTGLEGTVTSGFNKICVTNGKGQNINYTNIVLGGGNFPDAIGWSLDNSTLTANNNIGIISGTPAVTVNPSIIQGVLSQPLGSVARFYVRGKLKVTGTRACTLISISIGGNSAGAQVVASKSNPTKDVEYVLSGITDTSTLSGTLFLRLRQSYASTAGADCIMECREVICFNISANPYVQTLEASLGRVLTSDECDRLFAFTTISSNIVVDTQYALSLDVVNDYGSFINTPSLDITTGEFALACTFRVASGANYGHLLYKGYDGATNLQYDIYYDPSNKWIYFGFNNNTIYCSTGSNSILENIWYHIIIYKNSLGVYTSYLNKVAKQTTTNNATLITQPNVRLGARTNNASGSQQTTLLKGDISTQSVYYAPQLDFYKILQAEINIAKDYILGLA